MDIVLPKCAGLDVHQRTVVACARGVAGSSVTHDVRISAQRRRSCWP
jgi:hypothetical protein